MDYLRGQFVISRGRQDMRPGWRAVEHSGWIMQVHPSLPVHNVFDAAGAHAGWLVGHAIDTKAQRMLTGDWHLFCDASLNNCATIEAQLFSLAGRYVLFLLGSDIRRMYVDPSASLSLLYSLDDRLAGSSAHALGITELSQSSLTAEIDRTRQVSGTWYPCGLTQWQNLRVLPPNHFLDIDAWEICRHWPQPDQSTASEPSDVNSVVNAICHRLTANIAAVAAEHPTTMQLTAGRDTRMLLACSKPVVEQIEFETSPTHSHTDVAISVAMAEMLKLVHHISEPVNLEHALLQGAAGEVGRAFYWRNTDDERTTLTGQDLATRMSFPDATFVPLLQDWLDQIPHLNTFVKLDLLYIEHRLAMAHSPANYERDLRFKFTLFPLGDRRIFELMMSLPSSYRLRQALCPDICKRRWPELNLFPINAPGFGGLGLERYSKLLEQWNCKTLDRKQRLYLRERTFGTSSLSQIIFEDMKKVFRRVRRSLFKY